jgi:hypothetical protein
LRLDPVEDRQAASAEQIHVDRQGAGDPCDEGLSLAKQVARAFHFEAQKLRERRRESPGLNVNVGHSEPLAILARKVDAANVTVARHILPEIGELETGARKIGEPSIRRAVTPAQVQNEVAHWIGGPRAVIEELVVRVVVEDSLILFERRDQSLERLVRDAVRGDDLRQCALPA